MIGDEYLQDNADHWRALDEHDEALDQRRHAPAPRMRHLLSRDDTVMKRGSELEVGDTIVFLGGEHRIVRFEPYRGPLVEDGTLPSDTRIAHSIGDWAMTIPPDQWIEVVQ